MEHRKTRQEIMDFIKTSEEELNKMKEKYGDNYINTEHMKMKQEIINFIKISEEELNELKKRYKKIKKSIKGKGTPNFKNVAREAKKSIKEVEVAISAAKVRLHTLE